MLSAMDDDGALSYIACGECIVLFFSMGRMFP
jgi:hypothetical protein